MCTAIILAGMRPDLPIVVAANRDEFYQRSASGPTVLRESPRAVGGVDLLGGGSWLGVTARGFFSAITNQRGPLPRPGLRSRGQVVLDALALGDSEVVAERLRALEPGAQNSFNLLFGDAAGLRVAYYRQEGAPVAIEVVPPGIHVLPNDHLDSPRFAKVERARALVAPAARAPWPELCAALATALADHWRPPIAELPIEPESPLPREALHAISSICVHGEAYGTRSATVAALAPGRVVHYLHSTEPLCRASLVDHTALLDG